MRKCVCILMVLLSSAWAAAQRAPDRNETERLAAEAEARRLRQEYLDLEARAKRLGDGGSVTQSITNLRNRQAALRTDIIRLEKFLVERGSTAAELEAIRKEIEEAWDEEKQDRKNKNRIAKPLLKNLIERLPPNARVVFWVVQKVPDGVAYVAKELDVSDIDEMIKQEHLRLGDLHHLNRARYVELNDARDREIEAVELQRQARDLFEKAAQAQRRADLLSRPASAAATRERDIGDVPLLRVMGVWEFTINNPDGTAIKGYMVIQPGGRYLGVFSGGQANHIDGLKLDGNVFTATPFNQTVRMTVSSNNRDMSGTWVDGWSRFSGPLPATMRRVSSLANVRPGAARISKTRVAIDIEGRFLPIDERIQGRGIVASDRPFSVVRWYKVEGTETMRVELDHPESLRAIRTYLNINGNRVPWNFAPASER